MSYELEFIKDIFVCGWNDSVIENPFRWYEDCTLQLVYNYGRIQGNQNIIVAMPESNELFVINEYFLKIRESW